MKNNDFYAISDRVIRLLNRKAVLRFEDALSKCSQTDFDELNVLKTVKTLYAELNKDNIAAFLNLAQLQYEKMGGKEQSKPDREWLFEYILLTVDPVTMYQYDAEVLRKRDRAGESITVAQSKSMAFRQALRYWSQQTAQYADIVTDQATIKAFKDGGVKKVRWKTEKDDKVCSECDELNDKVFPIDAIPVKPHWHCRCWIEAVR